MNVCTYPAPWESLTVGVGSFLCKQLPALTQQNLPANCNNHAWVRFAENLRKICWIIGRKAACVHHTKPALQKLPVAVKTNSAASADRVKYVNIWLFWKAKTGLIFYIKLPSETSQELRMLSPSLCIQRSQCNCSYCCSQVSSLRSQVSRIAHWGCSLNGMAIVIVYFGQVMSPHHSDQMSHRSQKSLESLCCHCLFPKIRKSKKIWKFSENLKIFWKSDIFSKIWIGGKFCFFWKTEIVRKI